MPKPGKAPLMALRERLSKIISPPKQELVVPDDLYDGMKRGDGRAVETVSRALGRPTPSGSEGLRLLSEEVSPSRRGFLKGIGQGAAHLIMPSPLRLLQETADALGPRLTAELTPMELMEYSKKHFDKPLAGDFEWFADDLKPTVRNAMSIGDVDFGDNILEAMGLKPTQQNRDSIDRLSSSIYPFNPDDIDAGWDDMKHVAQDYAAGAYVPTDELLYGMQRDFGFKPNVAGYSSSDPIVNKNQGIAEDAPEAPSDFEERLNQFLESLHNIPLKDENGIQRDSFTDNRRYFDDQVDDAAHERGYMDTEEDEFTISPTGDADRLAESRDILYGAGFKRHLNDMVDKPLPAKVWREAIDDGEDDTAPLLKAFDELYANYPGETVHPEDMINSLANYFRK